MPREQRVTAGPGAGTLIRRFRKRQAQIPEHFRENAPTEWVEVTHGGEERVADASTTTQRRGGFRGAQGELKIFRNRAPACAARPGAYGRAGGHGPGRRHRTQNRPPPRMAG
ncbi:hypothetical protein NUM3379_39030 [Kineococcus sp. NUM-3379]